MNYIHRLQDEVCERNKQLVAIFYQLQLLRVYLESAKFRCGHELDGYVSVTDVLLRLPSVPSPETLL